MTEPAAPTPEASVTSAPVPAPAPPPAPVPTEVNATKPAPPSPAVLGLGFIILVLLGAILAINLKPKPTTGESSSDRAARMKKDFESVISQSTLAETQLAEKDNQILEKTKALIAAERDNQTILSQYNILKTDLGRALADVGNSDLMKRQLADALKQADVVAAELSKARAQLADYASRPAVGDMTDLQRRFDEISRAKGFYETQAMELKAKLDAMDTGEVQHLRAEVARLQALVGQNRLFAASENELLPASVELYRGLQKLQHGSEAEGRTAYGDFGVNLGAGVVKVVTFPTGSSTPSPTDDETLKALTRTLPDEGLLLVVGYASETGNVDANRALSSERATAVAKSLDGAKLPGQKVQAVYLGQTSRFDAKVPERNQLCEIWQIRSKN